MYLDFGTMQPPEIYLTLTQTVIPRPVAWVLSENADGGSNLAPFSFFNAICSDPPLIMISVGRHPDGSWKDTRANIEARDDFVVHIGDWKQLDSLNESSATLPPGESEVHRLGLETVCFERFRLPRLDQCQVAFACSCYQIQAIGDSQNALILGRIHGVYLADGVVGEDNRSRRKIYADKIDPIGRLGADEFVRFGEICARRRPP